MVLKEFRDVQFGLLICRRTTKITRLPPRDFDFRKRPIGNSGAFFCSSKPLSRRGHVVRMVSGKSRVWQWGMVNLSEGERRWMLRSISKTERFEHGHIKQQPQAG